MEALGAAGSVITVIDMSAKLLAICSKYARGVRDAKGDIEELLNEVTELQKVAKNVQRLLNSPPGAKLKASRDLNKTLEATFKLLFDLEKTLQPETGRKLMSRVGLRSLKWPLQSAKLHSIVQRIRQHSNTIALALQVDQTTVLLDVDNKIDRVDDTLESVDQRMLLEMLPTTVGVSYNSHAEEHNSTCLENTRVELIRQIDDWVNDRQAQTILWLSGMTGTGKSTISRTVATTSAKRGYLGAIFFFKRGEADRGNLSRFYTTIAHQLACSKPNLAGQI
ncbi:hypothetical protein QQX98_005902 [Neonectria punicea]|uniref:Nephrocystin 3-like N-terminal domain-containing protein n=1 Tax=Neonectria punicea TaxID=979145 RepID=A0ABR1H2Q6_9HYPO